MPSLQLGCYLLALTPIHTHMHTVISTLSTMPCSQSTQTDIRAAGNQQSGTMCFRVSTLEELLEQREVDVESDRSLEHCKEKKYQMDSSDYCHLIKSPHHQSVYLLKYTLVDMYTFTGDKKCKGQNKSTDDLILRQSKICVSPLFSDIVC